MESAAAAGSPAVAAAAVAEAAVAVAVEPAEPAEPAVAAGPAATEPVVGAAPEVAAPEVAGPAAVGPAAVGAPGVAEVAAETAPEVVEPAGAEWAAGWVVGSDWAVAPGSAGVTSVAAYLRAVACSPVAASTGANPSAA